MSSISTNVHTLGTYDFVSNQNIEIENLCKVVLPYLDEQYMLVARLAWRSTTMVDIMHKGCKKSLTLSALMRVTGCFSMVYIMYPNPHHKYHDFGR